MNISTALSARAREAPDRVAMHFPHGRTAAGKVAYASITYAELERDVATLARALPAIGIGKGVRAALMVRPGPEFFALMFALMRAGSIPVLIDPGIDKGALKACLAEAAPQAFIGIPVAHVARIVLGWGRGSIRTLVTVGRRWFWGGHRYADLLRDATVATEVAPTTAPDDLAAILFTSGSTGIPKGVEYKHRHFAAQVDMIRDAFGIEPGEIDLPTFPPFALFDPALGMTTVLPEMDFARPASADPVKLAQAIEQFGATMMFGSPALIDTFSRAHSRKFPTLKRVLSAGAPVRPDVVERMRKLLRDDAALWTPYGATECLPLAIVEGREILDVARARTAEGAGILVGRPVAPNLVRIIAIDDAPIETWRDDLVVPDGVVGEITVTGPTATEAYFRRDAATRLAKIRDGDRVVHRMGDLGWFDENGRLWYVGRKSHRVATLYTEQVEGIFNDHPRVARSALVGVAGRPVVCIEVAGGADWPRLEAELRELAQRHAITRAIENFLPHRGFPVDIRHNAKIGREKLAAWAADQMGIKP